MGVYLDNAATSWPKPEPVYQAVDHFMREVGATPGVWRPRSPWARRGWPCRLN
jgi:selenocysteine lyase/cysteine desulfurase